MQASSCGAHALVALPRGAVWRQAAEEPGDLCAQPRLLCRGALLLRATWERSGPSITSEAQCRETLTSTWRRDSGTGGDGLDDGALLSGGVRYVDVRNGA
jgi:hypothetical protein